MKLYEPGMAGLTPEAAHGLKSFSGHKAGCVITDCTVLSDPSVWRIQHRLVKGAWRVVKVIDVKIELRQTAIGWEQVDCSVELHGERVTVLDVPARIDEIFPSKDIAIATLKERVTFELQQHHRHESGDDVNWIITIHPVGTTS